MIEDIKKIIPRDNIRYVVLMSILWAPVLLGYMRGIVNHIPILGLFTDELEVLFVLFFIIVNLNTIVKHIKSSDLVFLVVIFISYILNFLLFPENGLQLEKHFFSTLFLVVPYYLYGRCINVEKYDDLFYVLSIICICLDTFYFLYYGQLTKAEDELLEEGGYSMNAAYKLLPYVLFVIWRLYRKPTFIGGALSFLGVFLLLSYGTRGPIVCLLSFVVVYFLFFIKSKHAKIIKTILVLSVLALSKIFNELILLTQGLLIELGMSSRIFDKYLSGDITEDSGREDFITTPLLNILNGSDSFWGHGYFGSYNVVGTYPHNIIIEFMFTFGKLFGLLLLFMLAILIFKALINRSSLVEKSFFVLLICTSIIKLLMTGTFLDDAFFFFMIGYGVQLLKRIELA